MNDLVLVLHPDVAGAGRPQRGDVFTELPVGRQLELSKCRIGEMPSCVAQTSLSGLVAVLDQLTPSK